MSERTLFTSNMQRSSRVIDLGRKSKQISRETVYIKFRMEVIQLMLEVLLRCTNKLGEACGRRFSPTWKSL